MIPGATTRLSALSLFPHSRSDACAIGEHWSWTDPGSRHHRCLFGPHTAGAQLQQRLYIKASCSAHLLALIGSWPCVSADSVAADPDQDLVCFRPAAGQKARSLISRLAQRGPEPPMAFSAAPPGGHLSHGVDRIFSGRRGRQIRAVARWPRCCQRRYTNSVVWSLLPWRGRAQRNTDKEE